MILDILTVLFFVLGFALILWMVGERRRDVLHYVTKSRAARGDVRDDRLDRVVARKRRSEKQSSISNVADMTEKDAFDLWWEWADKPVDNKPTIDAAIYDAVMALPPDERRDRAKVNELLEQIDRPALKSLPSEPYEFSEWRMRRVGIDYHIEVAAHYYSVPIASPA